MAPNYYCLGRCTEKSLVVTRHLPFHYHKHTKAEVIFPSSLVQNTVYGMGFGGYFLFLSFFFFRPETLEAKAYVISSIIYTVLDTSTRLFIIQGTAAE